jgi:hypothetical protein
MLGLTKNVEACRRQWRIGELQIGRPGGRGDLRGGGLDEEDAGLYIGAKGWQIRDEIAEINSAMTVASAFTARDRRA